MAINRANGGIVGTVNAPKAELITSFTSSGTFISRHNTSEVDVLVVGGGGGLRQDIGVVCRQRVASLESGSPDTGQLG